LKIAQLPHLRGLLIVEVNLIDQK